jgi:transcriptional regulator with XRE-family HTH domain
MDRITYLREVASRDSGKGSYFEEGIQVRLRPFERWELQEWELTTACSGCGGGRPCRSCAWGSGPVRVRCVFWPELNGFQTRRVRALRERSGRTQEWLSYELGVNRSFVSRLETSSKAVSSFLGGLLREVLGCESVSPIFVWRFDSSNLRKALENVSKRRFAHESGLSRSQLDKMLSGQTKYITQETYDNLYERE